MKQFTILLKKDIKELFKTKKVLILCAIFFIFAFSSPLIAKMTPELLKYAGDSFQISMPDPTIIDSYVQFFKNIDGLCLFATIIIFAGIIANEKAKGLYTNLINNNVTKSNFILSKIVSQVIVITGVYLISILLFSIYNYILFDKIFMEYSFLALLSMYIYMIFVICVVNLCSTISKSNIISIVVSFVVIFSLDIFSLFSFGKYLPNYLVTISNNIFTDASCLDYIYKNIAITLLLSIISVVASIRLCSNKE
ncbi:MAG: hypothetical protein FWF46_07015 [Oscillospiraceae bacterium]|nr:hypothetical protein [Oscillospiraceae bacterium]